MADQAVEPADDNAVQDGDNPRPPRSRRPLVAGLVVLALAAGLTLWAGWSDVQVRHAEKTRAQMVDAGRAALLALTTVDHTEIDRDVQRILDTSTGAFYDDFAARAESFKTAARTAQSVSVGTVREAGLETRDGDSARVLVAMTVMTSNRGEPEQQPKSWRTRVTVTRVDDGFKVAAVEFVP